MAAVRAVDRRSCARTVHQYCLTVCVRRRRSASPQATAVCLARTATMPTVAITVHPAGLAPREAVRAYTKHAEEGMIIDAIIAEGEVVNYRRANIDVRKRWLVLGPGPLWSTEACQHRFSEAVARSGPRTSGEHLGVSMLMFGSGGSLWAQDLCGAPKRANIDFRKRWLALGPGPLWSTEACQHRFSEAVARSGPRISVEHLSGPTSIFGSGGSLWAQDPMWST